MKRLDKTLFGAFLVAILWPYGSQAQGVKVYDQPPSAEEMAKILFPKTSGKNPENTAKPKAIKTRSISFGKPKLPEPDLSQVNPSSEENNSIGLPIKFGYNSAQILPESVPFLNEVGKMLSMGDYANERLVVEGHTDASGSEGYNQYLSEKRAEAVKNYLTANFNIVGDRLFINGMGEKQPLPGADPYAAVNRRVQFYRAP